jgi:hypothetical protein
VPGEQPTVTGDDRAVFTREHRHRPAVGPDRLPQLLDLSSLCLRAFLA